MTTTQAPVSVRTSYGRGDVGVLRPRRRKFKWAPIVRYALVALVLLFFMFPVVWLVMLSFKSDNEAWVVPPRWLFTPTLVQYQGLLTNWPFLTYYRNSVIVVFGCLLVSISLGLPLGYSLARFPWKRKNDMSFFIVSQLMLPPEGVIVPFYLICQQLGILRTLWAPMLVYITFTLPFIAWIMKGFFEALPPEIEEQAMVDGASRIQVLRHIVLPLVLGALFSTTMLAALTAWNEFFFAFILTGAATYTAPVGIVGLWTEYTVYWGQIAAGGVLIALPVIVFGLFVQKFLVRGLTLGAVK
jgi:multiple sugar transport system permease protein